MIDYGKPPSGQLEIPGLGADGEALYKEALKWAEQNPDAFAKFIEIGKTPAGEDGKASPNFAIQTVRNTCKVQVKNGLAAPLARIAEQIDPDVNFRKAQSKTDGFIGVKC